jgi:hypothetical protein
MMHKQNDFITLTYAPENLPYRGQLNVKDWELFIKNVRKHLGPGIRFFMCGEYGEKMDRPHYHAIIFGHQFTERKLWKDNGTNGKLYRSVQLERFWPHGHASAGSVTKQSCGYVARYVMKKVGGQLAQNHYQRTDPETGELYQLIPEFSRQSRMPGIGASWFEKFGYQVFDRDYVIVKGQKVKPPRYYEKLHDRMLDPVTLEQTKGKRDQKSHTPEVFNDNTDERLKVKETVKKAAVKFLKKGL